MTDKFDTHSPSLTAPASGADPVIPSDTASLPVASRAIYVGGGGALAVELVGSPEDAVVTLQNVQAGMVYPLRVRRVRATGTTATGLVCFW
ncbi:spike base protein, RCAP_Rcc01079 family [Mangrovicoccus algicola]|uniref:Uncharacterized protein n=1 Tax=Mangrovicoccus algicola TaxID=2771008 RepID=A0A8J6Z691_9RHOB|nr:hypothetical protein [Mangrovicoccus algicola]MBE3637175.1 hypothetical protein [Mangrovicoccus algicola]